MTRLEWRKLKKEEQDQLQLEVGRNNETKIVILQKLIEVLDRSDDKNWKSNCRKLLKGLGFSDDFKVPN